MHPNKRKFLNEQLADYQSDKSTDKRRAIIDKWFDREETKNSSVNQQLTEQLGTEIYAAVLSRITLDKPKTKKYWHLLSAAAAITLFMGIAIVIANRPIVFVRPNLVAGVHYTIYRTGPGQEKQIKLIDGTWVNLKPASSFRVPTNLGKAAIRTVFLDRGEAFFSVKRDTLHPFSIISGKYITTVLGTSFTIRTDPEHQSYTVAVKTGKVRVERMEGKGRTTLSPCLIKGEVLSYDEINKLISISETPVHPAEKIAAEGHEGNLRMTLNEIGQIIAAKYHLNVKIRSKGISRKYVVKLTYNSLEQTLNEVAMQTGMRYEINNKLLTITPGQ